MVQHSGGGKANQYFLRGFDADHGTDIALSIDGVPINMVSHAHGQGFADTNFIIPEAVERVEITKGPYFAEPGRLRDRRRGEPRHARRLRAQLASASALGGSPGHGAPGYRGLLIASPEVRERRRRRSPPRSAARTAPSTTPRTGTSTSSSTSSRSRSRPRRRSRIGEMSYGGNWHGSGQIPARAVESGLISRFGSIDPDEGGNTTRHQLSVQYKLRPTENSELNALAYVGTYRFNLFSNFTLYLARSGQRRRDRADRPPHVLRRARSATASCTSSAACASTRPSARDVRSDDIHEELWHTVAPRAAERPSATTTCTRRSSAPTSTRRSRPSSGCASTSAAAPTSSPSPSTTACRTAIPNAPNSGVDGAHQLSPKASLVVTPLDSERGRSSTST